MEGEIIPGMLHPNAPQITEQARLRQLEKVHKTKIIKDEKINLQRLC